MNSFKTLHAVNATHWKQDVGEDLAALQKRSEFQKNAESDCKKKHPSAYPFRNAGPAGKPFRDCVAGKMAQYDSIFEADKAAKQAAKEEASAKEAADTLFKQTEAETANVAAKTQLTEAENAMSPTMLVALVVLFAVGITAAALYYNKTKAVAPALAS